MAYIAWSDVITQILVWPVVITMKFNMYTSKIHDHIANQTPMFCISFMMPTLLNLCVSSSFQKANCLGRQQREEFVQSLLST